MADDTNEPQRAAHSHAKIGNDNKAAEFAESMRSRARWKREHDPYASETPAGFENENIRYLDARPLTRPLDIPEPVVKGTRIFLIAAIIVGALMLFWYFDTVVNAASREAAQTRENASRNVALDLPVLADLADLDDEDIMAVLTASGATLYEKTPIGSLAEGGFEVVKLPEGVSLLDAGASYAAGLDRISAANATRLLNGAWMLQVIRNTANSELYVGYADFHSGDAQQAIQQARSAEGWLASEVADSGVDDQGNTYCAGVVDTAAGECSWRVSVVPLSSMYKIKNMPEDALYVGMRLTT